MAEGSHISLLSPSMYAKLGGDCEEPNVLEESALVKLKSKRNKLQRSGTLKKKTVILTSDINDYKENKSSLDEALQKIIVEEDRLSYPEERIIAYASEYLLGGANIECTDIYGNTPLHQAAWNGFPDLAKELLQRGANVHALNCDCQTAVEIAINKGLELDDERTKDYSRLAALVMREMEPSKVRGLFLSSPSESSRLKFCSLIDHPDMQEATDSVLDSLIEKLPESKKAIKVYYSLLEANESGDVVLEGQRRSIFRYIIDTENKDVLQHPAVMLLITSKWRRFARNKLILKFFYWIITLAVIAAALILAATSDDSRTYDQPIDYLRGVCEGLMVLVITISVVRDILLIYMVKLKFLKEYKFFIFNYINLLVAVLIYIYIILHILNVNQRWEIASIAIALYTLKGIKYLLAIRAISNYFLILMKIIKHDILPFLVVFGTVLIATTGGLYLEQRLTAEKTSSSTNSSLAQILLVGVRMMVEGDKIVTYNTFSPTQLWCSSYVSWIGYGTYLVFMFFVVVVLQSLLIAQMSDTFVNIQVDAMRIRILNKARSIVDIEETTNIKKLSWIDKIFRFLRIKVIVITEETWRDPEKQLLKVQLPESVVNGKILSKLERMMTTQRELVEELRDAMMTEQRKLITTLESLTDMYQN